MTLAIGLPLLFVAALALRDVRLRRQVKQARAMVQEAPLAPEPNRWQPFSGDVGAATEAYAAYLNAPREFLDDDEQELFEQDLVKARAAMERAWLEAKPVRDAA
jgi:hypothetical protein